MNRIRLIGTGVLLLCLSTTHVAFAQLAPGSDGRLLDANNQVGSGGRNIAAPRNLFNTANLYITGNTTRGTAFRGFSPIRDQSSIFTALPSSVLSNFERDSVGLEVISGAGGVGVTNPFFFRTQTVSNAGAIAAGRNLIGSSAPANSLFAPRYNARVANQGIPGIDRFTNQYNINPASPALSLPGTYPLTQYPSYAESLGRLRLTRETDALQSNPLQSDPMFHRSTDPASLRFEQPYANPYRNPYAPDSDALRRGTGRLTRETRSSNDPLRRPSSEEMLGASRNLISPTAVAPRLFQPALAGQQRDPLTGRVLPDPTRFLAVRDGDGLMGRSPLTSLSGSARSTTDPNTGSARFATVTDNLTSDLQGYTPDAIAAAVNLIQGLDASPNAAGDMSERSGIQQHYERAQTLMERAMAESLSSLAGSRETSSADAIIRAEKKVQEGQYYQAAKLYELASRIDPDHAMPRLGHAHALFAAGEYMTAYRKLVRAIELYPAFGYLNFDLTDFIPDVNLIDIRRADLEKRLKVKEDYRLRFLLGYVENYIGLKQFALPNLRRAAGDAPANSVVARFPEILAKPAAALKDSEERAQP